MMEFRDHCTFTPVLLSNPKNSAASKRTTQQFYVSSKEFEEKRKQKIDSLRA